MKYSLLGLLMFVTTSLHATHFSYTEGVVNNGDFEVSREVKAGTNSVEVSYRWGGFSVEKTTVDGQVLHLIKMNNLADLEEKGCPKLPVVNDLLSVASSHVKVEILDAEYKEYKEFMVYPSQGAIAQTETDTLGNLMFSDVYQTNGYYPANNVSVVEVQAYRSYPFATVRFCPIQYNPVTKVVKCCTHVTYRLSWSKNDYQSSVEAPGDENLPMNYAKMPTLLRGVVADYVASQDTMSGKTSLRGGSVSKDKADYLIVTTNKYLPAVERFKSWKSMLGYKVLVLSTSQWASKEDVKDQIYVNYVANDKPEYLLIFGDITDVPSYLSPYSYETHSSYKKYNLDYGQYASDLQYSCMDGPDDIVPDMAAGRISVSSLDEANTIVDKIINYEQNPVLDESFYNTALHCAFFQDDIVVKSTTAGVPDEHFHDGYEDRRFVLTSEEIRNYMMGWGKTVDRVYFAKNWGAEPAFYNSGTYSNGASLPSELTGYGSVWEGTRNEIKAGIEKGAFYVLHRDHGNYYGWGDPEYQLGDLDKLNNGDKTPVVFSLNCLTGGFQFGECFSEKFLRKQNGGAVGVVGATAVSFSGYNDALAIGMFDAIYPYPGVSTVWRGGRGYEPENVEPIYHMGQVLNKALLMMPNIYQSGILARFSSAIFHYFGDPSMELRTEAPVCLDATVVKEGSLVKVSTPVSGCRISLCSVDDGGESYVQSFDGVSEATFQDVDFNYAVTVYRHNYVPFVYNGAKYIQSKVYASDETVVANVIYAGEGVLESQPKGEVVVKSGDVNYYASSSVVLKTGFSVMLSDKESEFVAHVDVHPCQSVSEEPESSYHAVPTEPQIFAPTTDSDDVVIVEVESNLTDLQNNLDKRLNTYVENGEIVVVLGELSGRVVVSDVQGKQVAAQNGSGIIRLGVEKGLYVVTVHFDESQQTEKVVNP